MGKRIDANRVRTEREKRGWSQEQLAKVSGLGVRTIQRIETEGNASLESGRALASVFEMPLESLWQENPEYLYDHYQTSYVVFILLVFGLVFAFIIKNLGQPLHKEPSLTSMLIGLFALVATFVFSSLRIRLTHEKLIWNFGFGLFQGSVPLSDIREVTQVRNEWWYGWGIRVLPHCILYNIYGLDAIEVTRANGRRTRLGTDEPEKLRQAIESETKPKSF